MLVPDNNDNSPFKVPGQQDEIPTSPLEVMKRQFLPKPPKFATKNKNKTVYREDVEKAAKLGFFLGWLGIHNFKINRTVIGLLQVSRCWWNRILTCSTFLRWSARGTLWCVRSRSFSFQSAKCHRERAIIYSVTLCICLGNYRLDLFASY